MLSRGPVKCPSTPNQPAPMTTAGGGAEDQRIAGFRLGEEADESLSDLDLFQVCVYLSPCKSGAARSAIARHPREERGTGSPGTPGSPSRPRGKGTRFWPKRKPGRGVSTLLDALLAVGFGTESTACALRSISTVDCSAIITAGELSCSVCPPLPLSRWTR